MLARAVPGAGVFVARDRALAGALAERRFGATVHVLDDGLQHLGLARDVELIVATPEDEADRLLPAGRLREPLDDARRADALLVPTAHARRGAGDGGAVAGAEGVHGDAAPAVPRLVEPWGTRPARRAPAPSLPLPASPGRSGSSTKWSAPGWTLGTRLASRITMRSRRETSP